jgi:hypothetical protein
LESAKQFRKQQDEEEAARQKDLNTYVPELLTESAINFLWDCIKNKTSCSFYTPTDDTGYLGVEIKNSLKKSVNGLIPHKTVDYLYTFNNLLSIDRYKYNHALIVPSYALSIDQNYIETFAKEHPNMFIIYILAQDATYNKFFTDLPTFKN